MSRTWKDQPIRRKVMNSRIHRVKAVLHAHWLFGKDKVEQLAIWDEDGTPSLDDGRPMTVRLVTGQYADYCTGYMDVDKMPEGLFAPCTTWFARERQGGKQWQDAAEQAWQRADRQRARVILQRLARENHSDVDDSLVPMHAPRGDASWWL